jgi:molybdopterin molybdotransferase
VRTGLSARDAALSILTAIRRGPPVLLPLDDALGCVLADAITSPIDVPFWTNSAMDGYAARGEDVRGASDAAPKRLRVVQDIPAGAFPTRPIGPGECARVFTGAPLPEGADSVIRQEDTDQGTGTVAIFRDRDIGVNRRRAGEDVARGATVFEAGTELGPAQLGVLASLAVARPRVTRRPRVAILASGEEIVPVDREAEILSGRKVASSNTHTLRALIRLAGGEPIDLGIAGDTIESLRRHLEPAREVDLLVTTAGISVGEHDHLKAAIESMGGRLDFWRIRMRPGAPVGFGRLGEVPWIGLPGNPVSTMVTFELFVRPAIRTLLGHRLPFRQAVTARVGEPIRLAPTLQHFLRGVLTPSPAGLEARLTGPQGSGILTSMARATALLVIPEGQHETPAGAAVSAIPLDGPAHVADPAF